MWLAIAQPSPCENRIKASWRTLKTKRIRLLPHAGQDLTKPPGGLLRCLHAPVLERQFRGFSGVFMTPHWRSLFVSIIVKRRLQMIKEFDNYIHLNQASMLNYGARYRSFAYRHHPPSRRQTLWSIGE